MQSDPFDDQRNIIHLYIRQCKNRIVTTIQGFQKEYDLKKILLSLKKELNCGGTISHDNVYETIVLNGDQRDKIINFLIKNNLVDRQNIRIHG